MVDERELKRQKEYQRIVDNFNIDHDYQKMYLDYAVISNEVWADKERKDYESDLWYNLNCNEICLEMLGNLCEDKTVIDLGAAFWIEKAFLDAIKAETILRTDLIADEGVLSVDAQSIPFMPDTFDVVICRELIEHVPDEQKVFNEIHRVLKTGGYLLLTTPNAYSLAIDGTFHVRGYTPFSLLAEIERHGFEIVLKRGNLPACFHGLKIFSQAGIPMVLDEYKKMWEMCKGYENMYYLGTSLFVLARKTLVKKEVINV
ncbi:class I SAM-dependent methyltransferase [Shewanella sp.]|jgi:SAM-dependent methyltransferase|uniref:class I SAM-dependent methyltransferase n=1 Tax=Shewanella sp. TaxID=50422 RepID=UPI003565A6DC